VDSGDGEPFGGAEAFTKMWTEFATKMASAGMTFTPDSPPPEAARHVRNAMFDAMSSYCETFMRSPQFMEMMKQSMDNAIAFRKQLNTFMTRMHHETQGVAQEDMDSVIQTLKSLQHGVVDRLDDIADRLDDLSKRVEAMEKQGGSSSKPRVKSGGASKSSARKNVKKTTRSSKKRSKR